MSRDDGFAVADLSVHLYDDDKVKRLYRELGGDLGRMGHAMMLCEATLLASWRDGRRRTVEEAAPIWLSVDVELVDVLVRVGLLDRTHRKPVRSWKTWFGPAFERREKRRRSGALGGRPRLHAQEPLLNHPDNNRKPRPADRPVRPTDIPTSSRGRAREAPSNNGAIETAAAAARNVVASLGLVKS